MDERTRVSTENNLRQGEEDDEGIVKKNSPKKKNDPLSLLVMSQYGNSNSEFCQ